MIWHPGPGRLRMPDQHQPSTLPRCHGHSVPGPIQQVPALENAVTASERRTGSAGYAAAGLYDTETPTRRHCHIVLITAGQEHWASVIHGAESAVTRTAASL